MFKNVFIISLLLALVSLGVVQADPIHDAAIKGDVSKIKLLLKTRPNLVNSIDKDGATALHFAVAKGRTEIVKLLLENKANVNSVKDDGVTPLHVAAALGQKEIAEILIANKADVNAKDKKNRTPLDVAQSNNKKPLIDLLLAHNAVSGKDTSDANQQPPMISDSSSAHKSSASFDVASEAKNFVYQLTGGDYAGAVSKFDSTMQQAMPETKLRQLYSMAIAKVGNFKQISDVQTSKEQGYDVANVACEFEKGTFKIQVAFNSDKQISGVHLLP